VGSTADTLLSIRTVAMEQRAVGSCVDGDHGDTAGGPFTPWTASSGLTKDVLGPGTSWGTRMFLCRGEIPLDRLTVFTWRSRRADVSSEVPCPSLSCLAKCHIL
jgi:hypothetical protein